jgi:hypothetical protein
MTYDEVVERAREAGFTPAFSTDERKRYLGDFIAGPVLLVGGSARRCMTVVRCR